MKTINNTTSKGEGVGVNSLGATPRERNSSKGCLKTQEKTLGNSRPPGRRPSITQQRRRGGLIHQEQHQGKGVALKEAQEYEEEH